MSRQRPEHDEVHDPEEVPVRWSGPSRLTQAERDAIVLLAEHAADVDYDAQLASLQERECE
jgi:hypothetical protein